ncbi:glucosyl-3-phosphoglycerate synthase [Corynebacterium sp. P7003]|uniref:Glucosyl-3-phosphoglycerate synthase n=1 Tax=Corynebacterium pygosceleis TaxID=2800406 RepID=A0ABT3WT34_9CORY|nr:glucosyl-3-phosphoglycerate synthase [Corynebacterium pygosceleis]MCX7444474.1 glucosyl-3-phosphoglycerate synthase [Corynebacterium pygosceleis]
MNRGRGERGAGGDVSVVIPALNEEDTVAGVVGAALADSPSEVLVIDSGSGDATAERARAAGARVLSREEALPGVPVQPGKGEVLWRGVAAARGALVVFIDADLTDPAPGMVRALTAPFTDPMIQLVKGDHRRPLGDDADGGGRVTRLTALPLLRVLNPELTHIRQPLTGEYAIRRGTALGLPFVTGWGVESALLLDVASRFGPDAVTSVDLGVRRHRNKPTGDLEPVADAVAAAILSRHGVGGAAGDSVPERPPLSVLYPALLEG